jgi:hypothetical protein
MKKIKKSDLSLDKDVVAILTPSETSIIKGAGVETNNTLCLGCDRATFASVCLCMESYQCESVLETTAKNCCSPDIDTTTIKPLTFGCQNSLNICLITEVSCA